MKHLEMLIGKKILTFVEYSGVSASLSFIVMLVDKYLFADWEFIVGLMILIILDTVLGFFLAYRSKKISSDGFSKLFTKLIVYMVMLICSHTASHLKANGSEIIILAWLDSVIYSGIIVREILSLFEKCALIKPDLVPKFIIDRLRRYNETGD